MNRGRLVVRLISGFLTVVFLCASCASTLPHMKDGEPVRAEKHAWGMRSYYQEEQEQALDQNSVVDVLEDYEQTEPFTRKYRTRSVFSAVLGVPATAMMIVSTIALIRGDYWGLGFSIGYSLTYLALYGGGLAFSTSAGNTLAEGVDVYNEEIVGGPVMAEAE